MLLTLLIIFKRQNKRKDKKEKLYRFKPMMKERIINKNTLKSVTIMIKLFINLNQGC